MRTIKIVGFVVAGLFVAYFTLPTTALFLPLFADKPTVKDWFYAFAANDFDAPQLCGKVSARAYTYWEDGNQYDYLRSACYEKLALITRNAELCAKVRPLTIGLRSGVCSKRDCEIVAPSYDKSTNCDYRTSYDFDRNVIPFILSGLGYTATKINALSGVSKHNPENGSVLMRYIMPVGSMSKTEKEAFVKTVETADLDAIIKGLPNGPSKFEILSPVDGQKIPWDSTMKVTWHFSPGIDASVWGGEVGIAVKLEQLPNSSGSFVNKGISIDSDTNHRIVGYIRQTLDEIADDKVDITLPTSKSYEVNLPAFLKGHGFYDADLSDSNKFRVVVDVSYMGLGKFYSGVFTIVP